MAGLKYIARVLRGASLEKLNTVIDRIRERCGWSRARIFMDIMDCAVRYGAGYNDYLIFAYWEKDRAQRSTMVTRVKNKRINEYLNDPAYAHIFDRKSEFNKLFADYLRRDILVVSEADEAALERFMEDKEIVFAKPDSSESGKGIERLKKADFASAEKLYRYVREKNFGVLEEEIVQHEAMRALYPLAVNTLRIATVVGDDGKTVYCPYATAKMGNEGKFVDNMENSGLCCPVDLETGRMRGPAHTSALVTFDEHPYTHIRLDGYEIPYAKEAVELAKRAALVVPQMRHIGWDVCIMPDGPAIVEGNDYPGYDFSQLPEHTPDKTGLAPFFRQFVPGI